MKPSWKSLISLLLVLVFVFQLFPASVLAVEADDESSSEETISASQNPEGAESVDYADAKDAFIIGEVDNLREESVKHFRMSDGTYVAVEYGSPVHYQNLEGSWNEIDNTLLQSGSTYNSVNGEMKKEFSATLSEGKLFELNYKGYKLGMSLVADEDSFKYQVPEDTNLSKEEEVLFPLDSDETTESSEEDIIESSESNNESVTAEEKSTASSSALPQQSEEPVATSVPAEVSKDGKQYLYVQRAEVIASIDNPVEKEKIAFKSTMDEMTALDKNKSEIKYVDALKDTDFVYTNYGYDLKESIIIKQQQNFYQYSFSLNLEGLEPVLQKDGSILLYNIKKEPVFEIPTPYMFDANGTSSDLVEYKLVETNQGYILIVIADSTWINEQERAFPVNIDPTVLLYNTSTIHTALVCSGKAENVFPASTYSDLRVGKCTDNGLGQCEIIMQVEQLPSLPANCTLVNAQISLVQPGFFTSNFDTAYSGSLIVQINKMNGTYDNVSSLTYTTAHYLQADPTILDYQTLSRSTISYGSSQIYWDVTRAALDWVNAGANKGAFLICAADCANQNRFATIFRPEFSDHYVRFFFQYRSVVGLEDYYTYQEASAGRAGDIYINDFTQKMTLAKPLVSLELAPVNFSITGYYNSCQTNSNFTNNPYSNINTCDFGTMKMGHGWKLSVQQTVVEKKIGEITYLIYTDEDGTEHYFEQYNGTYKDEDGLGLTITKSGSGSNITYTMKDQDAYHTWTFNKGYLTSIKDHNNNMIYIAYNNTYNSGDYLPKANQANQINQVVQHTNSNSATNIVVASFTYNSSGFLTRITDYAGRETNLSYNANHKLSSIVHPDGMTATYSYHSYGGLISAFDGESKCGIEFSYWNNHGSGEGYLNTVNQVKEFTASTATGNRTYGNQYHMFRNSSQLTSMRYYGADHLADSNTNDDLVVFNAFDYYGRTITSYTTNQNKSALLGVSAGAYSPNSSSSPEKNNRLSKATSSGQHVENLILDSSIEHSSDEALAPWIKHCSEYNANATIREGFTENGATVNPHTGNHQLKAYLGGSSPNSTQFSGLIQSFVLTENITYVFSAYVNTSAIATFGSDANNDGAFLSITGPSTSVKSEVIHYRTNPKIEGGWERISLTFCPTNSGSYYLGVQECGVLGISAFDDVQLEIGDTMSKVNLIQDSAFERTSGSKYWSDRTIVNSGSVIHNQVVQLTGDCANTRRVSQTVMINKPSNTTFLLSGWGKASSVFFASKDDSTTYDRFFGLIAKIKYTDGNEELQYVPFSPMYTDWQYASSPITPKSPNKTVQYIEVSCAFDKNANTPAWFDEISLIEEPCQTYTYDTKGNPISATSDKAKTTYEYYSGTNKLKNYKTPSETVHSITYKSGTNNIQSENVGGQTKATNYTYYNDSGSPITNMTRVGTSGIFLKATNTYDSSQNHLLTSVNANGIRTDYSYHPNHLLYTSKTNGLPIQYFIYNDSNNRQTLTYMGGLDAIYYDYENGRLKNLSRKSFPSTSGGAEFWQRYVLNYDTFGNNTDVGISGSASSNDTAKTLVSYIFENSVNEHSVSNGRLASMMYPNSSTVSYTYDLFDRISSETYNVSGDTLSKTYQYHYDSEGNLSKQQAKNSAGSVLETYLYDYDSLGRLIHSKELDSAGNMTLRTEHLYDTSNRLSKQGWMFGDEASATQSYSYSNGSGGDETLSTLTNSLIVNGSTLPNSQTVSYSYTNLKQIQKKQTGTLFHRAYSYHSGTETNQTLGLVHYMNYRIGTNSNGQLIQGYRYTYDNRGNIAAVYKSLATGGYDSNAEAVYTYDNLNQLTGASGRVNGNSYSYSYTYDTAGNLLTMTGVPGGNKTLSYTDSVWKDRLTKVQVGSNWENITYETASNGYISGNPTSYYNGRHYNFTWQKGRQLATATVGGVTNSYTYDMAGVRSSKTDGTTEYKFDTLSGLVMRQTWDGKSLYFLYDDANQPYGFAYLSNENATPAFYYYILNQQGDVVALLNSSATISAIYRYDPWGAVKVYDPLNFENTSPSFIGNINPLRYRGYYYDSDTGLYYLQSRYYDPAIGRFINADCYASTGQGFVGCNMFAYCLNNPINYIDASGNMVLEAAVVGLLELIGNLLFDACITVFAVDCLWEICSGIKEVISEKSTAPVVVGTNNTIAKTGVIYGRNSLENEKTAIRADVKIRAKVRQDSKYRYWTATVRRGYIDVGRPLTFSQAVKEVRAGRSVMAVTSHEAYAVARAAGGRTGRNNSPLNYEIDSGKGKTPGYYYHYHTFNRSGGHVYFLFF